MYFILSLPLIESMVRDSSPKEETTSDFIEQGANSRNRSRSPSNVELIEKLKEGYSLTLLLAHAWGIRLSGCALLGAKGQLYLSLGL